MNKTDRIILSTAALLAITFTVSAQDSGTKEPGPYSIAKQITDPKNGNKPPVFPEETYKPVDVDDDNKIAFTKNISMPFKDGTDWIKLESFATGEASYKMTNAPADIVLVLDMSSSMNSNNYTTGTDGIMYEPINGTRNVTVDGVQYTATYSYQLISGYTGNNQRYISFHGEYRPVYAGRSNPSGGGYYYLYFEADGQTYYLDGTQITTTCPTKYTANGSPIWEGTLFIKRTAAQVTRLRALKEAVAEFIEEIYHNAVYENEGYTNKRATVLTNRISIVVYSTYENQDDDDVTKVLVDWTDVATASGDRNETILKALAAETYHTGTASDDGMVHAFNQIKKITDTRKQEASQTVVMFSDGSPHSQTWSDSSSGPYANLAIGTAKEIEAWGATVFSVLLYTGTPPANLTNYMQGLSSNYPNATSYTNLGARCDDEDTYGENAKEAIYYHNAGDDLSGVFKAIAQQSGGDSNTSLTAATSTVDIVSDSFVFPEGIFEEGADINDYVKVFTAKLEKIENGEYVFLEEVMAPYSTDTYDKYEKGVLKREDVDIDGTTDEPTISVVLDGGKTIKVTGFDYANNWCGPVKDEDGQTIDYQGHKMIIMIPIKMNPDAVGGPDVTTNIVGSGIIVPGQTEPIVSFESPTVSLPINLHIEKIGLNPGESAKFRIERAEIPLEGSWSLEEITDWHYVTSIFVTQPQGADPSNKPMVKVRGMASVGKNSDNEEVGYVYKITEEDWSWSYERDATPQYTVTTKVTNPFSFSNTKKKELEYKLRHAESKATNIFKMEGGVIRYDNSK